MNADPAARLEGATTETLRDAKRRCRSRIMAARDALPPEVRAADSRRIAEAIAALPAFAAARTVLLTLPFGSEWDARLLVARALAEGKGVAIPRVDVAARVLALHAITDPERDVAPGYRTIPEPLPTMPTIAPAAIDWVLVPGVAFDAAGHRLGYGGGYYDRLLPLLRKEVPRIAGAFELQVLPDVPHAPHDQRVDLVITPSRGSVRPGAHR